MTCPFRKDNEMDIVVQIDSREKTHAITHITKYFDMNNIKYFTNKLPTGDYQNLVNPTIIVDRKQNLTELQCNITQSHERFRNELIKAKECGIKLIILIEEKDILTLEDVRDKYINPRMKQWSIAKKRALNKGLEFKQRPPLSGKHIYEILKTMEEKYGCKFMFARKEKMAETIIKLLTTKREDIN